MAVSEVAYDVDGWGTGTLWFDDAVLVWHELPHPGRVESGPSISSGAPHPTTHCESIVRIRTSVRPVRDKSATAVTAMLERLERFFAGERVSFRGVTVDLDWCTDFQRAVARALRAVPWGDTVTYGELAALAGYPNAQRAAGTFCAHNRLSLVVPCHRVVSAGGIGSYGSFGVGYKRRLLALEGVRL